MVEKTIDGRLHLFADEGKIITDGNGVSGYEIILQVGLTSDGYYEITEGGNIGRIVSVMTTKRK